MVLLFLFSSMQLMMLVSAHDMHTLLKIYLGVCRATTRERALQAMIGLLSMQYNYDCAVQR